MRILALDFSSSRRSVAVVQGADDQSFLTTVPADPPRETTPAALVQQALDLAGLDRARIDHLAVGLGPGSYTGIRLAIAFAQGWQLVRSIPVAGLSSSLCLAWQCQARGDRGLLHVAIDAQRGDYALGTYQLEPEQVREREPLHLVDAETIQALAKAGEPIVGPGLARRMEGAADLEPNAGRLAWLAWKLGNWGEASPLSPLYLRPVRFVKAPPTRTW